MRLSRTDAYYLRSCLRQLEALKKFTDARLSGFPPTMQSEALTDTISHLDAFIERGTKHESFDAGRKEIAK